MFVITGGGRGLGKALALALADRSQSVMIIGRNVSTLKQVAASSEYIQYSVADVSTAAGREQVVDILKNHDHLQGLIHNAGIIEPLERLGHINEAAWHKNMATNLDAPLFLTQKLLPKLSQARVLHIGSGLAYFPMVAGAAYCVSKAALAMLTRCWQLEYQFPAFTSVMPGIVDTDMVLQLRESSQMDSEKQHFFRHAKETNQILSPKTVGLFLTWLLLDVSVSDYRSKEWDIYDTDHHDLWLPKQMTPPTFPTD